MRPPLNNGLVPPAAGASFGADSTDPGEEPSTGISGIEDVSNAGSGSDSEPEPEPELASDSESDTAPSTGATADASGSGADADASGSGTTSDASGAGSDASGADASASGADASGADASGAGSGSGTTSDASGAGTDASGAGADTTGSGAASSPSTVSKPSPSTGYPFLSACFFKYIFNCFNEPSIAKYEASIFEKSVLSLEAAGSSCFFFISSLYFAFKSSYFLRRFSILSTTNLKSESLSSSSLSLLRLSSPESLSSTSGFLSSEGASPTAAFKFSNIDFFSPSGASAAGAGAAAAAAGSGTGSVTAAGTGSVTAAGTAAGTAAAAGSGVDDSADVIPSFCRSDSSFFGASVAPRSTASALASALASAPATLAALVAPSSSFLDSSTLELNPNFSSIDVDSGSTFAGTAGSAFLSPPKILSNIPGSGAGAGAAAIACAPPDCFWFRLLCRFAYCLVIFDTLVIIDM